MIRLVLVLCFFVLSSAQRRAEDYGYDPCDGSHVGDGYYNLAGETSYNRRAELVCDFDKSSTYDRVTDIAWIMLDEGGSCSRAEAIRGDIKVDSYGGRSTLTISDYGSRDHGVYRCFGTEVGSGGRYSRGGRLGRARDSVVYMDVAFRPNESLGRYRSRRYRL